MIALYIIGGLLAFIALLLSSPVSVRFFYRETPELILRVWGYPIRLLPRPPEQSALEEKPAQKSKKQTEKTDKPSFLSELHTSLKEDGIGTVLQLMGELAGVLKRTVGKLLRAVTVKNFQLHMRISGKDAAAAATNYGKVCAAFYPLFGALTAGIRVKKHDVDLRPDFVEEGNAVLLDVTARISLWKLTGAALTAGFSLLCLYMKIDNTPADIKERTVNDNG